MSTLQDRVKLALQLSGKSKTDLWKGCGVSSATVTTWVKGPNQTIGGVNLMKAARVLGVNPDWLATGAGEMLSSSPSHPSEIITLDGTPSSNLPFNSIQVNSAWVKSALHTESIERLKLFFVNDDAMTPTFKRGDFLLIDTHINAVENDGVYLIKSKAGTFLKRININLDGSLTIKVDNPIHHQEVIADLKEKGVKIIGKALIAWSEKILK